ncbi:SiaB family protein kinase [Magnetospira thiophila]
MFGDSIYDLRTFLRGNGVLFCYGGVINESVLKGVGDALRRKMASDGVDLRSARGVFSVFVEQMQNVIRYSEDLERGPGDSDAELRHGVLVIGQRPEGFTVLCGNMMRTSEVPRLSKALTEIQAMSRDQMKKRFKEILRGAVPEGSKGAGVGFLDIALRATQPIAFRFQDAGDGLSFFSLDVTI